MPSSHALLLFSGATLLLLLVPGPAVLYIVTRSTDQGRRAGLVSVAGIHTGTTVHVAAALAGLSAVVVASATAFTVVKYAGAAYLVYLGVRSLLEHRTASRATGTPVVVPRSLRRVFFDGFLVNVLNPKTAVFFLAFVPQFVDVDAGSTTIQLLVLSAVFIGLGLASDGAYALGASWVGGRLAAGNGSRRHLVAGTTYIGLGVVTAVAGGRSS